MDIILIALGKSMYGVYAFNLAQSIRRYYGKDFTIHLFTENSAIELLNKTELEFAFDTVNYLDKKYYYVNGKANYVLPKLHLTELAKSLKLQRALYIDVDNIIVPNTDLKELYNSLKGKNFVAGVYDEAVGYKRRTNKYTFWINKNKNLKSFLEHNNITQLQAITTDMVYFEVNDFTDTIFLKALEIMNLENDKYVLEWRGIKPDEYCFNLALSQLKITLPINMYSYFSVTYGMINLDNLRVYPFYCLSIGGDMLNNRIKEYYNYLVNDNSTYFETTPKFYIQKQYE